MYGKIHAIAFLGVMFALHLIRLVWRKVTPNLGPGPVEVFTRQFADDGIFPMAGNEQALLAQQQFCIGCGLCRLAGAQADLIATRELRDLTVPLDAGILKGLDISTAQSRCPVGVPLEPLAALLTKYAAVGAQGPGAR